MSDHLVSYLESILAGRPEGHAPFQWLSDEETAAIETDDDSELSVRPWIDAQRDIDPSVCARFGERSLFMRGLLVPETDEPNATATLSASDELQLVVDARRLGVGYVLARAVAGGVRTALNNVLQARAGTFEEEIDDEGIHVFSACTYRAAVARLAEWTLPSTDHAGAPMRTRIPVERWQPWIVNELGTDVRAVEINMFLPGDGASLEPRTWLLADGFETAVLAIPDGDSLRVTSMTRTQLREHLTDRIATSVGVSI